MARTRIQGEVTEGEEVEEMKEEQEGSGDGTIQIHFRSSRPFKSLDERIKGHARCYRDARSRSPSSLSLSFSPPFPPSFFLSFSLLFPDSPAREYSVRLIENLKDADQARRYQSGSGATLLMARVGGRDRIVSALERGVYP